MSRLILTRLVLTDLVLTDLVLTDEGTVAGVMPPDSAMPTGVQAAAAYIRELLLRPGRYRRKWEQHAERSRAGQVNQLAVADVLAHYLWQHPRTKGDLDVLPRQLKDTASRALSGKLLSKATLVLFMDARARRAGARATSQVVGRVRARPR